MILFGKKGLAKSLTKGDFHCPNCDSSQTFDHKSVRSFVTLYQVPIIPLSQLGDYVECMACKDTYKPRVLDSDIDLNQNEFKAEYHAALKEVMIRMLLIDGHIRETELEMIQMIYQRVTQQTIDIDLLKQEVKKLGAREQNLSKILFRLQGNLNDEGKEMVLRAAFYVAMADGEFDEPEQELLANIGSDLGMTSAHFQGVISTA